MHLSFSFLFCPSPLPLLPPRFTNKNLLPTSLMISFGPLTLLPQPADDFLLLIFSTLRAATVVPDAAFPSSPPTARYRPPRRRQGRRYKKGHSIDDDLRFI